VNSTLRFAALLSAGGGFLDSYAWVAHGHVFTNAQTGNIILFGVFAAQEEWRQALRYVPPMLAFFPGVFTAQWLHKQRFANDQVWATAVSLCVEVALLTVVGILSPTLPDTVAVFAIAFAAAMQSSGFQRVGKWSYTSVVTTANLRSLAETLFAIKFLPHNPEASDQARALAAICAFFVCSAIVGATLTVFFGKSAIVFPIIFLSLAALSFVREEHVRAKTGPPSSHGSIRR
jgi:uncharacterized membrane protein YoaK (UPF0700 family)